MTRVYRILVTAGTAQELASFADSSDADEFLTAQRKKLATLASVSRPAILVSVTGDAIVSVRVVD